MLYLKKLSRKKSSRRQIRIKGIYDGVLVLPGNKYRAVLQVSSVNLELKSEDEKDALLELYEGFLNSVCYGMQFLVQIRELDLEKYLMNLNELILNEGEEIYKSQIESYIEFLRETVKDNKILTRNFYIVISNDTVKLSDADTIKEQINLRCDIVTKGLSRLGINSKRLSSLEILNLFYSSYNSRLAKLQPVYDEILSELHSSYVRRQNNA